MSDWSSTWWGGTAAEEEDDDTLETEQEAQWDMRDSLILVFDCSLAMFQKSGDEIPFQLCVKCALSILNNKIISSDKDLVGIVFFGTEKRKNTSDFNHVYIFQDLDMPDAERILQLENFLKDDSCDNFRDKFGHSSAYSINDVLWTCSNMFSKSSRKGGHKRLMLFTNNDNPHADNPALQRQAKTRARDLSEIGISIELMHMQPSNHSFDSSLFYQDVVEMDESDGGMLPDPAQNFEELLTRVQKKQHGKRAMTTVPFMLSEGVELGVSLFNVRASAKKSSCINLDSRTNEPVKTHTKYICVDTGRELLPTDVKLYQMFGGEKVIFEKEEVAEMYNFGAPGLLLMGFKPRSSLKRYFHIKPAQFLYPSEKTISGTTRAFSALLSRCIARDMVPICRFIRNKRATPRFVALLPQSEEVDEHNVQINAPGFHVMFLPFADDLRRLKYDTPHKATPEQVNKAKEIIQKLTTGFDSLQFLNPSLQKHYKNLEALALDRDEPEKVVDLTEPQVEVIDRKAGQVMKEFKELVFPDNYDPGNRTTAKKKQAGETTGTSAKKIKTDGEGEINMREEAQQGRLSKLTVPVLKEFVRQAGIKCGTKKADLVEAIKQHFGAS